MLSSIFRFLSGVTLNCFRFHTLWFSPADSGCRKFLGAHWVFFCVSGNSSPSVVIAELDPEFQSHGNLELGMRKMIGKSTAKKRQTSNFEQIVFDPAMEDLMLVNGVQPQTGVSSPRDIFGKKIALRSLVGALWLFLAPIQMSPDQTGLILGLDHRTVRGLFNNFRSWLSPIVDRLNEDLVIGALGADVELDEISFRSQALDDKILWNRYAAAVKRGSAKVFIEKLPNRLTAAGQGGGGPLSIDELKKLVVTSKGSSRLAQGSVCHTDSAKAYKKLASDEPLPALYSGALAGPSFSELKLAHSNVKHKPPHPKFAQFGQGAAAPNVQDIPAGGADVPPDDENPFADLESEPEVCEVSDADTYEGIPIRCAPLQAPRLQKGAPKEPAVVIAELDPEFQSHGNLELGMRKMIGKSTAKKRQTSNFEQIVFDPAMEDLMLVNGVQPQTGVSSPRDIFGKKIALRSLVGALWLFLAPIQMSPDQTGLILGLDHRTVRGLFNNFRSWLSPIVDRLNEDLVIGALGADVELDEISFRSQALDDKILWNRYAAAVKRGSAKVFIEKLPNRLTAAGQGGGGPLSIDELKKLVVTSKGSSRLAQGSVCHTDSAKAYKKLASDEPLPALYSGALAGPSFSELKLAHSNVKHKPPHPKFAQFGQGALGPKKLG
ncbi:timm16 [Symbiodinium sp. CCMP2592]|nr:timm16 [Symbiodinium sp. CCMP2592]